MQDKTISGFSKWSKEEKVKWLAENFFADAETYAEELSSFWHGNVDLQRILDGFSENTISNYIIPYGIAPNFLINDRVYAVPMVIDVFNADLDIGLAGESRQVDRQAISAE